jgi:uncharacterized protein with ATP-grasp and redox domains
LHCRPLWYILWRPMDVTIECYSCLKGLVEKTVALSHGGAAALSGGLTLLDRLYTAGGTPPAIANRLLAGIKETTGVYDPYAPLKEAEYERAAMAVARLKGRFEPTLEGALRCSALGNSTDFFVEDGSFDPEEFLFSAPVDKIEEEIYIRGSEVLILGDNVGDFLFDIALIRFLEGLGRRVFYTVREHPVQNDLSLKEVASHDLGRTGVSFISTGLGEVGIRREQMKGALAALWEGDALVIAKGMGNYETITEFNRGRPVVHIMKIKCRPVGEEVHYGVGSYVAMIGGERDGRQERLL